MKHLIVYLPGKSLASFHLLPADPWVKNSLGWRRALEWATICRIWSHSVLVIFLRLTLQFICWIHSLPSLWGPGFIRYSHLSNFRMFLFSDSSLSWSFSSKLCLSQSSYLHKSMAIPFRNSGIIFDTAIPSLPPPTHNQSILLAVLHPLLSLLHSNFLDYC